MEEKETTLYLADEPMAEASTENTAVSVQPGKEKQVKPMDEKAHIVREAPALRTENRKVFHMSDGTEKAVFYPEAVHTQDAAGVFADMHEKVEPADGGHHYEAKRNHFSAMFSKQETDEELFSMQSGRYALTVSAKRPKRQTVGTAAEVCQHKSGKETVVFRNVFADADVEYSVQNSGVKENILVKEKASGYRYAFTINCQNVGATVAQEGKRILFCDTESGAPVFEIPAPFMQDAAGAFSKEVSYELHTKADGSLVLSVVADSGWINAKERVFPVSIDPQIFLAGNGAVSTYAWNEGYMYTTVDTIPVGTSLNSPPPTCNDETCNDCTMNASATLYLNTWESGAIQCAYDEVWYKFTADTTATYTMYTDGSLDTMGTLFDSNGNQLASNDDNGSFNFCITAQLTAGMTYYLRVKAYSSHTGSYCVIVVQSDTCDGIEPCPYTTYLDGNGSYDADKYRRRMYVHIPSINLPKNARIKEATLTITQSATACTRPDTFYPLGVFAVEGDITTGEEQYPATAEDPLDFAAVKLGESDVQYTFDVTPLIDAYRMDNETGIKLAVKSTNECAPVHNLVYLYSAACSNADYRPQLSVVYTVEHGIEENEHSHTHDIGRFGQGVVDLVRGNLMFSPEDFTWSGNRMPVSISHQYDSALAYTMYDGENTPHLYTAKYTAMQMGKGWRLNVMQSVVVLEDGSQQCVYTNENGAQVFLKLDTDNTDSCCVYKEINDGALQYDGNTHTLTGDGMVRVFSDNGKLLSVREEDNDKNVMTFTYTAERLTCITDGAGREFYLDYSANLLTNLTAPDGTSISYSYDACGHLTSIVYPSEKRVCITYVNDKPASVTLYQNGTAVYMMEYTFKQDMVTAVREFGIENGTVISGTELAYNYSAGAARTEVVMTEQNGDDDPFVTHIVYAFDEDGSILSKYSYVDDSDKGSVDGEGAGIHLLSGDDVSVAGTTVNLLKQHGTLNETAWSCTDCYASDMLVTTRESIYGTEYGDRLLYVKSDKTDTKECGAYQQVYLPSAGSYTFSAYMRPTFAFEGDCNPGAFLQICSTGGTMLAESETVKEKSGEFTRLSVSFDVTEATYVDVKFLVNGKGVVAVNAPQLEKNPYTTAYNMLENSGFEENGENWDGDLSVAVNSAYFFTYDETCCHCLTAFNGRKVMRVMGNYGGINRGYQTVTVRREQDVRETFQLSGWAMAPAVPAKYHGDAQQPAACLRAVLNYADGTKEDFSVPFNARTDAWQFVSMEFSKSKFVELDSVTVYCELAYNLCNAYFDDIRLIRTAIETDLTEDDFKEEKEEETPTENAELEGDSGAEEETDGFEELTDAFGNALTETTFTDGEFGAIYRAFGYTEDTGSNENAGNDLIRETDARGFVTQYKVDPETSRNEEVTDRCGNKTAYDYDDAGRTTKVISKDSEDGTLAHVSYTYDAFDNLTAITRGDDMRYVLDYDPFHNLRSIGIDGKPEKLVSYGYKNSNGKLKEVTYANGDYMKAVYNGLGQMVAEKWYAACDSENPVAHYKYAYDQDGNIIQSVDILAQTAYTYVYEDGKLTRAKAFTVTVGHNEMLASRILVATVAYTYNADGEMTEKKVTPADSAEVVYTYTYPAEGENGETRVTCSVGGKSAISVSKNDSLGRKEFDELQLGTGFVSRQFTYCVGKATEEHTDSEKLKSTATTQLVSRIVFSDGRTIDYEYDPEERITKVIDSIEGTTEYTYDAMGQLLTEIHDGDEVNRMVYDGYGNILQKNGVEYVYDEVWKDQLEYYDGEKLTYDAQGNPITYCGHTLTWEKGRQLKSFDDITYTYNANGIRTSKTVDGVRHNYLLDGAKILGETWDDDTLETLYDNEDSVCGIVYNGTPYYFVKNLQGDIIAIADKNGKTVVTYNYDAWGKCTITKNTAPDGNLAVVNPYRYRGYYYDRETGLYYLQSRYYDPEVGRFVNADEAGYAYSIEDVSSNNLCVYCNNSPLIYEDPFGTDAILLQATKSVLGMGHTGMVFNYLGCWYYWYWGLNAMSSVMRYYITSVLTNLKYKPSGALKIVGRAYTVLSSTVKAKATVQYIGRSVSIGLNTNLRTLNKKTGYGAFDKKFYINGDFQNCFSYLMNCCRTKDYNLLHKNCMQTSIEALRKGTFRKNNKANQKVLRTAKNMVVPNIAFSYLQNNLKL